MVSLGTPGRLVIQEVKDQDLLEVKVFLDILVVLALLVVRHSIIL